MKIQKNTYEYQVIRALERKLYLINLRGGGCEKCGYEKNITALEFHHKDPTQKESQLDSRHIANSTMKWVLNEFNKCEVLCANCHRETHNPDHTKLIIENKINNFKELKSSLPVPKGKPKCEDCGIEINYTHKTCRKCKNLRSRKSNRPTKEILLQEIKDNNKAWCAKKYNVTHTTIIRWLK